MPQSRDVAASLTPEKVRELWAARLDERPEVQGRGQLAGRVDGDGGEHERCCLGVLCDLAVEHGVIAGYYGDHVDLGAYREVCTWAGLATADGEFMPTAGHQSDTLASLNDGGFTFPEIAAIIRDDPEGLSEDGLLP